MKRLFMFGMILCVPSFTVLASSNEEKSHEVVSESIDTLFDFFGAEHKKAQSEEENLEKQKERNERFLNHVGEHSYEDAKKVFQEGVDINTRDESESALYTVITDRKGKDPVENYYYVHIADRTERKEYNKKRYDFFIFLLENGADIEGSYTLSTKESTVHNLKPLHLAVREGSYRMVMALLQKGAKQTLDSEGKSPLDYALEGRFISIANILVDGPHRETLKFVTDKDLAEGQNPFIGKYSLFNSFDIKHYPDVRLSNIRFFLKRCPNEFLKSHRNDKGDNILHLAVRTGDLELVKSVLIHIGKDRELLFEENNRYLTPLLLAHDLLRKGRDMYQVYDFLEHYTHNLGSHSVHTYTDNLASATERKWQEQEWEE